MKRVWEDGKLTTYTKMVLYRACVLSTHLHGKKKKGLNTFHMCSLQCILGMKWSDHVPDAEVLTHSRIPSMFTLLMQR